MRFGRTIHLGWCGVAQGLVGPAFVVIAKPVSHAPAQFQPMFIAAQIDVLILEAPP